MIRLALFVVAIAMGRPDAIEPLTRVCQRESRCEPIGVHARDAHLSRLSWGGQVQLGHLDPACQPYRPHRGGWATRGPYGLNAAAHWRYLWECYSPAVLDSPWVSAWVAVRKYQRECTGRRRSLWCPRTQSPHPR